MQSCCFGFEQHRGRWAVFSAAFHHAERAPRVISSLAAESPTIRSFKNLLSVDTGILATRVLRARKTRKTGPRHHRTMDALPTLRPSTESRKCSTILLARLSLVDHGC